MIAMERYQRARELREILHLMIACLVVSLLLVSPCAASHITVNDAHCYIVDFTQDSDGLSALLAKMDEAGVDHVVIFGIPVVKKWCYYDWSGPITTTTTTTRFTTTR
jgi:hypothetical protein